MPEESHGLGGREVDDRSARRQLVLRHPGHWRAGFRQFAEDAVDQKPQFFRRDVAGGAHDHAVSGQNGAVGLGEVVPRQRADAFPRAFQRAAIGMLAPGQRVEGLAPDLVGGRAHRRR